MNPEIQNIIAQLEIKLKAIHPLPWTFNANIPFYVDIRKPRQSLSKYDIDRPTCWNYDDGAYAALAINCVPKLIEEIKRLTKLLEEKNNG